MKYVVAVSIFRFLRDCIFVPLTDKEAQAKKDLLPDHLAVCNQLMSIYTFHGWYICLYSTDIALIAQSNSFNHIFIQRLILRWVGEKDALALYKRLQFHGPQGARGESDWLTCQLINLLIFNILMSIYIFHCFFLSFIVDDLVSFYFCC